MPSISRRGFLARSSLALGAAAIAPQWIETAKAAESAAKRTSAADIVTLGKSGIKASLLGMGTGMNGVGRTSHQLKLGLPGFTRLLRHGIDRGLRYIDTADQYGTHIFVREALKGVDRGNLFIQTKTLARHPEVARADIERFRQELGMDVLDTVLLHCMTTATWPTDMRPVMDVLSDYKAKGKIRAVGVSCHGWAPLSASVECDWIDVQLARINASGAVMDDKPEKVAPLLARMHEGGRGVIGMKICGGGEKTGAQDRLKSLRYVLGLGSVDCFVVGFESTAQLDEVCDQIETVLKG